MTIIKTEISHLAIPCRLELKAWIQMFYPLILSYSSSLFALVPKTNNITINKISVHVSWDHCVIGYIWYAMMICGFVLRKAMCAKMNHLEIKRLIVMSEHLSSFLWCLTSSSPPGVQMQGSEGSVWPTQWRAKSSTWRCTLHQTWTNKQQTRITSLQLSTFTDTYMCTCIWNFYKRNLKRHVLRSNESCHYYLSTCMNLVNNLSKVRDHFHTEWQRSPIKNSVMLWNKSHLKLNCSQNTG